MSKRHSYEFVKEFIEKECYTLVSTEYKRSHDTLETVCPNGHVYLVSFSKWKAGRRCLCESGRRRFNEDVIKDKCDEFGFTFVGTGMDGYRRTVRYICEEGHENEVRLDHFENGHGCSVCVGNKLTKFDDIVKIFKTEGYNVLSKGRGYYKDKIEYTCNNGHNNSITWGNWLSGHRCPDCAGNKKITEKYVKEELIKSGYDLIDSYKGCQVNMHLVCPNGHNYHVNWDNWKHKNSRCPKCGMIGVSKPEKEIIEFLETNGIEYINNNRTLITPYELDIVIPDSKIAIEYCGLYWHSEDMGKLSNYHINKLNMCKEKGYRLITIFEDEFLFKKEIVFSIILLLSSINKHRIIYGRNCTIKEISSYEAKEFCNNNHLQNYINSSIRIGAFYKNELVSVMTFSKFNLSKGYKKFDDGLELTRFCCKKYTRIIGIASKLLKYFERNYRCAVLLSYADRRWSDGDLYYKLGFVLDGYTKPNYWYIDGKKRIHRFKLRKNENGPKDVSERVLRVNDGYNRIWDCGNIRYIKQYNI